MGCLSSNGLPLNEEKKNENNVQNNLPKKTNIPNQNNAKDENLIVENLVTKDNNSIRYEKNKIKKENKINALSEKENKSKEIKEENKKEDKEDNYYENKEINEIKTQYKNEINLIYLVESENNKEIFGDHFIDNNKDNIELIINGIKYKLDDDYELKQGENIITLIIKKQLTDLSNMFCLNIVNL